MCSPGQQCKGPHSFGTFCRSVASVPHGYAAVRFDVDLDGKIFYPSGNNWRATALYVGRFCEGRQEVRENYCCECGSYTEIDDVSRLCDRCYRSWLDRRPPRG